MNIAPDEFLTVMKSPSRSRGTGDWGFHLRDGYATKALTLRAIPATGCFLYDLGRGGKADIW
jgi:hypothetical protein